MQRSRSTVVTSAIITFVTPHQNPTSGGVYAIHQLVRYLSRHHEIHLVVNKGIPHPVGNASVHLSKSLDPGELPDADVIVINADTKLGEQLASLPDKKGIPILYFQGYGTPESSTVIANLKRKWPTIVSARWLSAEAQKYESPSRYVSYGLDRNIFFTDSATKRDDYRVAMMTHPVDWKGSNDGIEALSKVRLRCPQVDIQLFGILDTGFSAQFIEAPSRSVVAAIMRKTTAFVCSSWEEGFGMPGLEALACGAALATTDTKGSRDYAIHGETALVTPPHDPEALAESILRLLNDMPLRKKLCKNGIQLVESLYPSWEHASLTFLEAVREMVA